MSNFQSQLKGSENLHQLTWRDKGLANIKHFSNIFKKSYETVSQYFKTLNKKYYANHS